MVGSRHEDTIGHTRVEMHVVVEGFSFLSGRCCTSFTLKLCGRWSRLFSAYTETVANLFEVRIEVEQRH
jgi:hypothetical protein